MTDDGTFGTPVHPHCPCIGDYPHIGVDGNGFYLTTNEYSFFGPEFNSAQVYAFSKRALARGDADVLVTQFDTTGADRGLNGFTIWPAQSPADRPVLPGRRRHRVLPVLQRGRGGHRRPTSTRPTASSRGA